MVGNSLKAIRLRLGLTPQQIEEYSQKIAEPAGNPEFYISNAWLTQIETKECTPSIYKLQSFSVIYRVNLVELLELYGVHMEPPIQNQTGQKRDETGFVRAVMERRVVVPSCFISYAETDGIFSDRLYADLQNRDVDCWYFSESANLGKGLRREIGEAIRKCDRVLFVSSQNSLNSKAVIDEIERVLQREDSAKSEILLCVTIDDYLFGNWQNEDWEDAYKAPLKARVVGDFRKWEDSIQYSKNFEKLLKALKRNGQ